MFQGHGEKPNLDIIAQAEALPLITLCSVGGGVAPLFSCGTLSLWELTSLPLLPPASLPLHCHILPPNWSCDERCSGTYLSSRVAFWCSGRNCLFRRTSNKAVMFSCMSWRVELGSWTSSSSVWFRVIAFLIISMEKVHQSLNKSLKSDSPRMGELRTFSSEAALPTYTGLTL